MDIRFTVPDEARQIASILDFQTEDESAFWTEPLFHFYPQLQRERAEKMTHRERMAYIAETMRQVYRKEKATLTEKAERYAAHWRACRPTVEAAFSDAFETDTTRLFNDLAAEVSLNPIEPRYLKERRFGIFYGNSERGAIGGALHEMTHFLWFDAWARVFGNDPKSRERPSLIWILSEAVVEPILSDERLVAQNPYYPRENGGCVYPYFFEMRAGNEPVMERLHALWKANGIDAFLRKSYRLFQTHEAEIREQIERFEGAWK